MQTALQTLTTHVTQAVRVAIASYLPASPLPGLDEPVNWPRCTRPSSRPRTPPRRPTPDPPAGGAALAARRGHRRPGATGR